MTRINCVPPAELSDAHLGAEYRELSRVFGLALAAHRRGERPDDPRNPRAYTLGRGHVRFFYPRIAFLVCRFDLLVDECWRRGRRVSFDTVPVAASELPAEWFGTWTPTEEALAINRARIAERSPQQKGTSS